MHIVLSFRCTNTDPGQSWLSEAFDDIGWQVATKIFQNTGNVPSWNVRTDIDSDAEWIWTTGWHGEDKTIWCRKVVAGNALSIHQMKFCTSSKIIMQLVYITGIDIIFGA